VKALALRCDLNHEDEIDHAIEEVLKTFGRIDILVNNAGRTWGAPVEELKIEDWKKVIDLNITGTFQFTQRAGREMIKQKSGKIIKFFLCRFNRNRSRIPGCDSLRAKEPHRIRKDLAVKWGSMYSGQSISGWFLTEMTVVQTSRKKMIDRLLQEFEKTI
jgi:gluconate 5-dehydrogenase